MMGELKLIIEPDNDEAEAAAVYVDGSIDGRPYRFLLDTGAARSSVIFDEYTSTLSSVGKNASSSVFTASSKDLITIHRLEVGPITKTELTLTRAMAGPGSQNLIGMDVLQDFCCHFLFDEHRVWVGADCLPEASHPTEELLVDEKFHPYVPLHFEAVQASAVWDTGASLTVVDIHFINRHRAFFEDAGTSMGTDAVGTQIETPMFRMSSCQIGGYLFPPHRVAGVDLSPMNATLIMPMDLIIGYSTYSRANWLFDFPRKRWMISKWLDAQ
jgi:hypothetical protein